MRTKAEVNRDMIFITGKIQQLGNSDPTSVTALKEVRIQLADELDMIEREDATRKQSRLSEITTAETNLTAIRNDPEASDFIKQILDSETTNLRVEKETIDVKVVSR